MTKRQRKFNNLGERIYWAYANLCMFFFAMREGKEIYDTQCYMVRERMNKRFKLGEAKIGSMYIDSKRKMMSGDYCAYCYETNDKGNLTVDHILPKSKGGKDVGDNLIMVCKKCNSSKRDMDLLEWSDKKEFYIDPWVLRNYLKLVSEYAEDNGLMKKHRDELNYDDLPFNPDYLPIEMPSPKDYGFELEEISE